MELRVRNDTCFYDDHLMGYLETKVLCFDPFKDSCFIIDPEGPKALKKLLFLQEFPLTLCQTVYLVYQMAKNASLFPKSWLIVIMAHSPFG